MARRSHRSIVETLETRRLFAAHIVGNTAVYSTIQAAINAAAPGATINVDAGSYSGQVTINKSLTLRGAQAGVDARNSRGSESILTNNPTAFMIAANDVTIDGFTVQGTGANIGAGLGAGVYMAPNIHGTHVVNNIIQGNITGIYLSNNSDTDAAVIQKNVIQNNYEAGQNWTYGWNGSRAIYSDGSISGGLLTNVWIDNNRIVNTKSGADMGEGLIALQAAAAGSQQNITITNNILSNDSKSILFFNVTNVTYIGNTVTNFTDGSSGPVRFEGNASAVNIEYNSIHDNGGPGIAADSSGAPGDSSGFVVKSNNIYNQNSGIGLLTIADIYNGTVFAAGNYWGSSTGPSGDGPGTGLAVWANGTSGHYITPSGSPGGSIVFSPWSTTMIDITKIPVPGTAIALNVTPLSASQLRLEWTASVSTAFSQLIQRSTDGVNFTAIATVSPLLHTYTDSNLAGGTKYYYRIIGSNLTGNSAPSTAASNTTAAPSSSAIALSSLNWSSATTGYGVVQRNQSVAGNALTLNGNTYATGIGTHAASTISYSLAGQYTTFTSDVGIDSEEDTKGAGYVDFKVVGDGITLFDSGVLTNGQLAHINVNITGVKTLQLLATNGISGNIDYDHADWAGATLVTPVTSLPNAPTNVAAATISAASIQLTWASASGISSYAIDRSTDGVTFSTIATAVAGSASSYVDSGLSASTKYFYRLRALNALGPSANSATTSATTAELATVTYLSDLTSVSSTVGWGTIQKDKSVVGNPLTLNGITYAKGIGTHAASSITYNLAGKFSYFSSNVGVDSEEDLKGSGYVDFLVYGDGVLLYDSGVLTNGQVGHINVSIAGIQNLQLIANNGVVGSIDYDHADWAGAQLSA